MKFKAVVLASLAALGSSGSFATTTLWGPHDPVEFSAMTVGPGAFFDLYTFSLSGPSSLTSSVGATNISSALNIVGGTYGLWSTGLNGLVGDGDDISLGAWAFNGSSSSTTHTASPLLAGTYYYTVGGGTTGSAGGLYTLVSSVSAVPEPEALAMMLAGLGAIGFLAARRNRG